MDDILTLALGLMLILTIPLAMEAVDWIKARWRG